MATPKKVVTEAGPGFTHLYVVRHAHAGGRSAWGDHDDSRPLSKKGRRQAEAIADLLAAAGIERVVSSPAVRCRQTLEPLASRLGVGIEHDVRLAEGASAAAALALASELRDAAGHVALCSHGDVIPELLRTVRDRGARVDGDLVWPKASTWVIGTANGRWASVRYLPPPATA
jgi:8-oxo-(d)GTP phosphatase